MGDCDRETRQHSTGVNTQVGVTQGHVKGRQPASADRCRRGRVTEGLRLWSLEYVRTCAGGVNVAAGWVGVGGVRKRLTRLLH